MAIGVGIKYTMPVRARVPGIYVVVRVHHHEPATVNPLKKVNVLVTRSSNPKIRSIRCHFMFLLIYLVQLSLLRFQCHTSISAECGQIVRRIHYYVIRSYIYIRAFCSFAI